MKDYFVLAFKNLRHRGIRSWLTLLGIVIGVTAVVSLISLGNGLQAAVSAQFSVSSTQVLTVQAGGLNSYGPPGSGVVNPLTRDDVEAIEKLSTVDFVVARNIESAKMRYNEQDLIVPALSVDNGDEEKTYELVDLETEYGRDLQQGDVGRVVIGSVLADGEDNGYEKDIEAGSTVTIQGKKFRVVGVLKKKGSFALDGMVIMHDTELEELMGYGDEVDVIGVMVKDSDLMEKAEEEITKLMGKRRDVDEGEEDFQVSTPAASLETVNSILGGVKAFIVVIASISIFVGAVGIVNTMTTSVLERKKEIGVMKSIGATNSQIFFQFFIESGLLGFVGGLIGVALGTMAGMAGINALNNFIGSEVAINLDFIFLGAVLVGSFFVGAVSGIVPAMNAAKQDPVEALRG